MNCNKANDFFMKYMDGSLSEEEAGRLHKHLSSCEKCAEDFEVYDGIMKEFSLEALCEAPEGFEACVMAKIAKLPPVYAKVNNSIDKVLWVVLGGFTVLMGLGFGLFINRDIILEYMTNYPALMGYAEMLTPVSAYVSDFMASIQLVVTGGAAALGAFVSQFKYVILAAAASLFGVQYLLYKRDKVEG